MKSLDIVIPVYDEGDNIADVFDTLLAHVRTDFRILICYDKDDDTTLPVIENYRDRLDISLVKNKGKGVFGAVVSGFDEISAPAVLVFPADDTFNAKIIDGMFQKFTEGCDIVAASRFIKGGCMKGCRPTKAILVRTAAFLLYHFGRLPVHDPTSGFRLFSKRVVKEIPIESAQGWCFSLELLVKSHRRGWHAGEVPALWYERVHGVSRFHVFKWMPLYLRWFFYAFETTFLCKRQKWTTNNS